MGDEPKRQSSRIILGTRGGPSADPRRRRTHHNSDIRAMPSSSGGFVRGEKPPPLERSDLPYVGNPLPADPGASPRRRNILLGGSRDRKGGDSSSDDDKFLPTGVKTLLGSRSKNVPASQSTPKWSSSSQIVAKLKLIQDASSAFSNDDATKASKADKVGSGVNRPRRAGLAKEISPMEIAGNRIRLAKEYKCEVVSLDGVGISHWPKELSSMSHLLELNLDSNRLRTVPAAIASHTALACLQLYGNELTAVPREIGQLTNLTRLFVCSNMLETLPPEIGRLSQLCWLSLDCNNLTSLPDEMQSLRALSWLSVEHNRLTKIPDVVGKLKRLSFFSVRHNDMIKIVPVSLIKLNKLTDFRYSQAFQVPTSVVSEASGGRGDAMAVYLKGLNKLGVILDAAASRTHWVEESTVKECKACEKLCRSTKFSLSSKKHHCRMCGGIFCKRCTSLRTAIPQLHYLTPARVCDKCYTLLTGREIILCT